MTTPPDKPQNTPLMNHPEYLQHYEERLQQGLVQMLQSQSRLASGPLPQTPDIAALWPALAPSYCADAVREIAQYPLVALGWAMYLGLAIAKYWDEDWATYSHHPNLYEHLRDVRGFDYLDEVVRGDLYGLKDQTDPKTGRNAWTDCEDLVRSCSQMAHDMIRHEQIEPSTPMAFHVYARSIKVLYLVGAAIGLRWLGYKMETM